MLQHSLLPDIQGPSHEKSSSPAASPFNGVGNRLADVVAHLPLRTRVVEFAVAYGAGSGSRLFKSREICKCLFLGLWNEK